MHSMALTDLSNMQHLVIASRPGPAAVKLARIASPPHRDAACCAHGEERTKPAPADAPLASHGAPVCV